MITRHQSVKVVVFLVCMVGCLGISYGVCTHEIRMLSPESRTPGLGFLWLFMVGVSVFVGIPIGVLGYWMIWHKILKRS
jgi:hypothetical protein